MRMEWKGTLFDCWVFPDLDERHLYRAGLLYPSTPGLNTFYCAAYLADLSDEFWDWAPDQ